MTGSISHDDSIFWQALEIAAPDDRRAFLEQACGGDCELRARISEMLQAYPAAAHFLQYPAGNLGQSAVQAVAVVDPAIGPYKLREVLGEGGMGIVYAAEQERPIRRKVALKVIKPGMDTREVIARFEAERQALALMDHPNIAKVLDAGATETGRPYFVMELVRGMPLTTYCDQAKLHLRARLGLFITVCGAIQHAHQRGIIHRDLKPSNVMVTLHDGVPVPKIIDFGVAKALNQRLSEHTVYTRVAQLLGTPMYMSPEQAELSGLDVDTRSDIYSLGVLLYELLTGQTPFDKDAFSKLGYDQVCRIIREEDPPRPSARISTLGDQSRSTVAGQRGIDGRQLIRSIRGELDWIAMKALEKDRVRRYGSADALAADVQNYLDDEPVEACPPSSVYRLGKFVRRKQAVAGAIGLAVAAAIVSAAIVVVVKDRDGQEVARVAVPAGGSATITHDGPGGTSAQAPDGSPAAQYLPGLIPQPTPFAGVGRWQLIRKGMSSVVHHNWKLAWSPDSGSLVVGDGCDVRVYSVPDLELLRVFSGHEGSVVAVDWSPDGTTIASCGLDNTVRLWNAEKGVPGPVLIGHHQRVDAVAWHPDSERLASGSRDSTVRLWNKDGTTGPVLHGHTDEVLSVAWNRDGSKLATTGRDRTIRIWNPDGSADAVIETECTQYTVSWLPNGMQLLTAQFGLETARIWNLDGSNGTEFSGHTNSVTSATHSPDGNSVASASWDDTVRLWSIDGTPGPILTGFIGNVYSVAWSPDGRWIAGAGVDHAIRLFQADGQPGPLLEGSTRVPWVEWSPDGQKFAATVGGAIRILGAHGDEKEFLRGPRKSCLGVDWSADGRQLVSSSDNQTFRVWNVDDATIAVTIDGNAEETSALAWHPRLPQFAVASPIRVCNIDGTALPGWAGHRGRVYDLAWNPVDERLASVGIDGTLRLWKVDGTPEGVFTSGELMASVAWKPNGKQLASGADSGSVQLWHPDGRPASLLRGHSDRVTSIAWSTDGRWLASGSRDNTIRIWSEQGEQLAVLSGHTGEVSAVSWQPHSSHLLSGSSDGTIRLWDTEAQRPEWISIPSGNEQSMKFDSVGRILAGDREMFERAFAYVIEQPSGAMEVLAPSEFEARIRVAQ